MNEIIKYEDVESEDVESKVFMLRGENVIIDRDVAELYGVETKAINQAVSRNLEKFPDGYIIILDYNEWDSLRSQIVTLDDCSQLRSQNVTANMNRTPPKAFTDYAEENPKPKVSFNYSFSMTNHKKASA